MLHKFIFYSYKIKNIDADWSRTTRRSTDLQKVFLWSHNKFALLSCSLPRQQSGRMLHKIEFTLYWKRQTVKRAFMCFGMWPNTRREIWLPVTKPGNVSSVPFWRPSFYKSLFGLPFVDLNGQIFDYFIFILLPQKISICSILDCLKFETIANIRINSFIWKNSQIHE